MPSLNFTEAELKFWSRIQECFDADARAKGINRYEHIIVIDMSETDRTFLTVDDHALAKEHMMELGRKMGAAVSEKYDQILMQLLSS